MKRILLASLLSITLVSSLYAYELNGELGVKWIGFKTEKKLPVLLVWVLAAAGLYFGNSCLFAMLFIQLEVQR